MYLCGAICFALATFSVTVGAVPFVALGLAFVAVGLFTQ